MLELRASTRLKGRLSCLATRVVRGTICGALASMTLDAPLAAAASPPREVPLPAPCKLTRPPHMSTPAPSRDKSGEPAPPTGNRGYDVLSYDLELAIDPGTRSLSGANAVGLRAVTVGLDSIVLDLVDDLSCERVRIRGGATPYTHLGERLIVFLDPPLATAGAETLQIVWQGRPPIHGDLNAGLMYREHDPGTRDDRSDDIPIVANVSEPWSAHSWWPCKDDPSDKALVSLSVTVPDTLSAVSNGRLLGVDDPAPGLRRYRWREAYPLAPYLVSVAITNYETWSEICTPSAGDPVRLDYHVFPQDRAAAETEFAPTCAMMDLMTRLAGPYPFAGEKYAQVEIKWIGAMEHATATSISQLLLPGTGAFETLIVHELAHQWFGDSLTPRVWADIWLNEGFARYCEALWLEESRGPAVYREFMQITGPRRHPDLFVGDGLLGDPDPILPNPLVYDKGAWLLHTLRRLVGDDAFFAFLRTYAGDPGFRHAHVTTADMIATAEAAAGRSLAGFFGPWLESDAAPVLSLSRQPPRRGDDPNLVRVRLRQHQMPLFVIPLTVALYGGTTPELRTFVLDASESDFTWVASTPVDSVVLDPDGEALWRAWDAPHPLLQVGGPAPNPLGSGGGSFNIFLNEQAQVHVNIYDMSGRKLTSIEIGLLAATVASAEEEAVPHVWTWTGTAPGNGRLPSGVYWFEFRAAGHRAVRKATLVR